jgi:hypothetical protein
MVVAMAMRETPNSLRGYFILVGMLAGFSAISGILSAEGNVVVVALQGINLALALGLTAVGAMAPKLISSAPFVLYGAVWANYGWFVLLYLLALLGGAASVQLHVQVFVGLAIALYLTVNVRRLSGAEATQ